MDFQQELVGSSFPMQQVRQQIRQVADSNATVLLRGETGTGKELTARAVHLGSRRASGPLVAVNCGALPEHLLEAELYGSERGAYTGSVQRRRGRVELADGGTLFLDEIGEISLSAQVKLLRMLQERTIERLGSETALRVDVRVIAATHTNLEQAIKDRQFREDLYYRLNVFVIQLPPLRDRRDDIPFLAYRFLAQFCAEYRKDVSDISPGAMAVLRAHSWPGNVRELQNTIERAVLVCEGASISAADLPLGVSDVSPVAATLSEASGEFERRMLEDALRTARGSKTRCASLLGTSERVVRYKVRKYGINCRVFKSAT